MSACISGNKLEEKAFLYARYASSDTLIAAIPTFNRL